MEPRYSLSAYAAVICAAEVALALRGFPASAAGLGIGITAWGLTLYGLYRLSAGAAARRLVGRRRFRHRVVLDRIVLAQLGAVLLVGLGAGVVCGATEFAPAAHAGVALQALILGAAVIITTVYVSALMDWFWVLPKIAGITREPPCVRPGGQKWESVTGLWLAHRAAATIVVTVVLAAIPGWLAAKTGRGGTESAAWVVLGTALGIGFNSISGNSLIALREAWNPRIRIGDTVVLRPKVNDEPVRAFVVDVSVQGFKYRVPAALGAEPKFLGKGKQVPAQVAAETDPEDDEESTRPICRSIAQCRAAYWYCCRNPEANERKDSETPEPVAMDHVAPAGLSAPPAAADQR